MLQHSKWIRGVTGNHKEMGDDKGVHWIHVAHDQIWKWVLQM
jgi:hypothetical protein